MALRSTSSSLILFQQFKNKSNQQNGNLYFMNVKTCYECKFIKSMSFYNRLKISQLITKLKSFSIIRIFKSSTIMNSKFLFRTLCATAITISTGFVCMKEKNNEVWSWGFGRNGELGLGSQSNTSLPQMIKNMNFVDIEAKKSISAGITIDGKLYTWGKNRNGIIGHHPPNLNVLLPRQVQLNERIVQISCGYENICAVTEKGEVYVWGLEAPKTSFRQRGITEAPKEVKTSVKPTKVDVKDVVQVSCSSDYITFLTLQGNVFMMGKSQVKGRNGKVSNSPSDIIQLDLYDIKKVQSGQNFSMALNKDGKVFVWGNNTFGQLGTGSLKNVNEPVELEHLTRDKVVDISCGDNYSGVVTDKGDVYTFGYGNQGQLGHGDKSDQLLPRKINNLNAKIVKISCGGGHTAMITNTNKLLMMGRGREGQLGRENIDESNSGYSLKVKEVEQLPKNKNISKVVCGGNHTLVLLQELV